MRVAAARTAIAILLAGAVPAAAAASRPDRLAGPFGRGSSEVWLLVPRGPIRAIIVFGHGWKVYPPSPARPWVGQFRPWLDHLAAGGAAVVFPRYQLGLGDSQGAARVDSFRQGLLRGFALLGHRRLPVVAVGYSFGATLAFYYAANAARWGLPVPVAVDAVFPAGEIASAPLPPLPASVSVLIQVGDADTEAGTGGADVFWAWLRDNPASRKRYETVSSAGRFVATHAAPKGSGAAARRAFWRPLDVLLAEAARGYGSR